MRKPAPLITTYRVGTISEATQLRDLITATTSKRVSGDSLSDLLLATGVQLRVTNTTLLGGNNHHHHLLPKPHSKINVVSRRSSNLRGCFQPDRGDVGSAS